MKLLLLDIDGVLNDHKHLANGYSTINPEKVYFLNEIVEKTGCKIIIVSAWRYLILSGSMTLQGFCNMLMTYGANQKTCDAITGYLNEDVDINDPHDRGKLAREYLNKHQHQIAIVVDDLALGYSEMGINHVQTQAHVGLTHADVERIVKILNSDS